MSDTHRAIAGLARIVRDVGLAEDLAQDALVAALEQWPESGVPDNPGAWLMATAKHRAIDLLRRSWSIARCLAVAMSQAPGLSGTPDSGHFSSAATRASCARSSAKPTSRTIRARPAMSLADSILQTASIARWVSDTVTVSNHTIFLRQCKAEAGHDVITFPAVHR